VSVDFRVLLPPGGAEGDDGGAAAPGDRITLEDLLDSISFGRRVERPYVVLNMICTADGRATIEGRSGPLGTPTDAALFHGLRTLVDGVLVGAGTLRTERYNRLVADASERTRRLARGLGEEPLACVVSASLALDPRIPLLADPAARVAFLTPSEGTLPPLAAHTYYVRAAKDGQLDLQIALAAVRERFAVRTLLCEGGPHLAGQLLEAGLLDELFLTLAPKLAAGDVVSDAAGGQRQPALSIISGPPLEPPVQLELASLLEADSYLFLRYRVRR
jgi:riboflavin biosynthesis pyrimidine reductase